MKRFFKSKRLWLVPAILAGSMLLMFLVLVLFFPLPKEKLTRESSVFVNSREGILLRAFSSPDQFWRRPIKLEDLPENLISSVMVCEDRWFYYHPGFNPVSIVFALIDNLKAGRSVRGGSTITMQIARMIEPKKRTITNKMIELFRALQLELAYSKKELLEFYFNLVPYGGNIEGIGAASFFYFNKKPEDLSISEVAILVTIPVRPAEFRPDLYPKKCRQRRDKALARMYRENIITEDKYHSALEEEIPCERTRLPFSAPHFCQTIATSYPDSVVINSTVNSNIQNICERLGNLHHTKLKQKNINNLSVVVIDNKSGELLAMIGSPDFYDKGYGGQVNGALAPRSPGSALKPFIYALGFEDGLISPELKLEDIPVNYAGYSPENYDKEYHGLVSVSEALINSFNVPAVNLTAEIGLRRFYNFLKTGGIGSLTRGYYQYGLPLILGSGEVSLLELSNLYVSLARGGVYRDIVFLMDNNNIEETRLLSEESCYLVSEILSRLKRPDLPTCWEFTEDKPKIAWKTGTSYGRKDAWTIGYNPIFTVGVWAGNFSAKGSVDIVGAEIAAPLMFDIFNEIMPANEHVWFDRPDNLLIRRVCATSGYPASKYCSETIEELYIPGVSPVQKCNIERKIYVNIESGKRLTPDCLYGFDYEESIVQFWPPRLATWLSRRGGYVPLPPFDESCQNVSNAEPPIIISPDNNGQYVVVDYMPLEYQHIMLEASSFSGAGKIDWFINNRHFASSNSGEKLFYLSKEGKHTVMCVDELGRSSSLIFEVNKSF